MFTIECYIASLGIDPVTRQLVSLGESPEKVGVICCSEDDGITVGEDNVVIFTSGCEALQAILTLIGDGEDLIYRYRTYRTSNP